MRFVRRLTLENYRLLPTRRSISVSTILNNRQKSEERSYYGQRAYDIFEKYHIGPITFVISIFIVGYGWKQYYINDMRAEFLPDSLKGKTILVTGASSGYGKLISEEIAIRGGKVIMASRSMNNLRIAKKEILNEHPDADIEITHLDLANLDSVENCAYKVISRYGKIDTIVNNAGVFQPSGKRDEPETVDGFERQFQVNFLGHFLLTELLKDQILENNGRILNILCTSMQKATLTLDPVDKKTTFKDIERDSSQMIRQTFYDGAADDAETKQFQQNESYMQSKLCLWLYTRYLGEEIKSRKNKSVCVGIDPGASKKTLFSRYSYTDYSYKSMAKYPIDLLFDLFERSAENCIQSVISALHPNKIPDQTDEEIQGKVITLHSTSFYDKKTAQIEGKRQYIADVVLTSGVQEQIYQIASLWSELEKRKIILDNKLKKS